MPYVEGLKVFLRVVELSSITARADDVRLPLSAQTAARQQGQVVHRLRDQKVPRGIVGAGSPSGTKINPPRALTCDKLLYKFCIFVNGVATVSKGEPTMEIRVNGETHEVEVSAEMPLLWVLRDELGITGPKYGCGIAQCGACTVHVDGMAVRSCQLAVGDLAGGEVTTIEGLGTPEALHAVQEAWVEQQVAQCGYCQSGQIMQAAALLETNPEPSDSTIDAVMSGNLCRCGTYPRIRAAVKAAAAKLQEA